MIDVMNIKEITNFIFLKSEAYQKSDLIFVFGTWGEWQESVKKAAKLYNEGYAPKVLVSGGINPVTNEVEGDLMAKDLEALGVPTADILIEDASTNTLENVLFSKPIIDRGMGLKHTKTITAVVKNYHARRALMTLRKHMPSHVALKAAIYISPKYPMTEDTWYTNEVSKQIVLGEVDKIKAYLSKSDIALL